ncbi:hypothetical protein OG897_15435 [Streptomyces sp. NBC_00237]|uniref:hypothetical protein n=1 Tax=Streptomyces sp. NBC_00237 TaxID=2975687 RepID=UPI0022524A00|nr:hypothetical protein [Streptomyces sp. NBC_00237]MCX5202838.1 hypothetical protein [Streptomyces sp. NBC_00237]
MTLHDADQGTPPPDAVGVRPRTEVEAALHALEAEAAAPHRQTQIGRGALAGYVWALGSAQTTPVTGDPSSAAPDGDQITAELAAAENQLADPVRRDIPREYVQGVWDALAWVSGRSDERA